MKKWHKVMKLSLLGAALVGLAACGNEKKGAGEASGSSEAPFETIKVAATSTPHAEILEQVKEDLKEQGYDLAITVLDDYPLFNPTLDAGDVDANFFQHTPYLESYKEESGSTITAVSKIHFEPLGIYPGKSTDLADVKEKAQVSIPNDATNGGRALLLLEANGLIELKDGVGVTATVNDITKNPHNLEIVELEAAQVPRSAQDVDFAVINANYALEGGFDVEKDSLASEAIDSEAAEIYGNVVVVREQDATAPKIKALVDALRTDKVRDFINENYQGAVVPLF
ncbi:MetQ/NlpA family ABC transporter substrate-binding protein [Enterococcus sp. LJL98]